MITGIGNSLSASLDTIDWVDTHPSELPDGGANRFGGAFVQGDGVDFASRTNYSWGLLDSTWNGEKRPKKDEETKTKCPPGTDPIITNDGREVVIVCQPPSPDKPKDGRPVPILP